MLFTVHTIFRLFTLATSFGFVLSALTILERCGQRIATLARAERQVILCSHLEALGRNIADAKSYLTRLAYVRNQQVTPLAEHYADLVAAKLAAFACGRLSLTSLQPASRRNAHPQLSKYWPNWVGSYRYMPQQHEGDSYADDASADL